MAAVLIRLRWAVLRNGLRGDARRTAGIVVGILAGLFAIAIMTVMWVAVMGQPVSDITAVTVTMLSMITAGWIIAPIMAFGTDQTLEPSRFALLPLSARRLMPGLVAAALVGIPGITTGVVMLGLLLAWARHPGALLTSVVAVPVGLLTAVITSRVVTTGASRMLSSRRFRDASAVILAVVFLGFVLIMNAVGGTGGSRSSTSSDPAATQQLMEKSAQWLGWTPVGWAWAAPADVAAGDTVMGLVRLALAVALLAALWVLWHRLLAQLLVDAGRESATGGSTNQSPWIERLFGATPRGAVAARCLRYWRRDPRYVASLLSYLVLPVAIGASVGLDRLFVVPVVLGALTGPALTADLAYDSSALWTHVVTGLRGRDDRWGRIMALGTIVIPIFLVTAVVSLAVSGRWDLTAHVLGAALAVCLCGAGTGCFLGAYFPGSAPQPGDNPFSTGPGNGLTTVVVFFGGMIGALVLALPVVILAAVGAESLVMGLLAVAAGLVLGGAVLVLGVRLGGRRVDDRWPELLAHVSQQAA